MFMVDKLIDFKYGILSIAPRQKEVQKFLSVAVLYKNNSNNGKIHIL
jgi:hypothetical protein